MGLKVFHNSLSHSRFLLLLSPLSLMISTLRWCLPFVDPTRRQSLPLHHRTLPLRRWSLLFIVDLRSSSATSPARLRLHHLHLLGSIFLFHLLGSIICGIVVYCCFCSLDCGSVLWVCRFIDFVLQESNFSVWSLYFGRNQSRLLPTRAWSDSTGDFSQSVASLGLLHLIWSGQLRVRHKPNSDQPVDNPIDL